MPSLVSIEDFFKDKEVTVTSTFVEQDEIIVGIHNNISICIGNDNDCICPLATLEWYQHKYRTHFTVNYKNVDKEYGMFLTTSTYVFSSFSLIVVQEVYVPLNTELVVAEGTLSLYSKDDCFVRGIVDAYIVKKVKKPEATLTEKICIPIGDYFELFAHCLTCEINTSELNHYEQVLICRNMRAIEFLFNNPSALHNLCQECYSNKLSTQIVAWVAHYIIEELLKKDL